MRGKILKYNLNTIRYKIGAIHSTVGYFATLETARGIFVLAGATDYTDSVIE